MFLPTTGQYLPLYAPSMHSLQAITVFSIPSHPPGSMDRNPNYSDKNSQIQGCKKHPSSSSVIWFVKLRKKLSWYMVLPSANEASPTKPPDCIIKLLIIRHHSLVCQNLMLSIPLLMYWVDVAKHHYKQKKCQAMVNLILCGSRNNSSNSSLNTSFQLQRTELEVASVPFHTW